MCTRDQWDRPNKHLCVLTYSIPSSTERIIIINLSLEKCTMKVATCMDDEIELSFGSFAICLCNVKENVKENFKVGLTGYGACINNLTLKSVSSKIVEFTIRPKGLITRLDRLCAGQVRNKVLRSFFCFPTELHQLLETVQVNQIYNSYIGPIWAKKVNKNSCVCLTKKVDFVPKEWSFEEWEKSRDYNKLQ